MSTNYELFFERIKKAAGCKTDTQLADFFGINKSRLSMWKKRESVDYNILFTKLEPLNVDLNWLIKGQDSNNPAEEENPSIYETRYEVLKSLFGNKDNVDLNKKIDDLSAIMSKFYFKLADIEKAVKEIKQLNEH